MRRLLDKSWIVVMVGVVLLLQTFESEISHFLQNPWISLIICLMCLAGFVVLYIKVLRRSQGDDAGANERAGSSYVTGGRSLAIVIMITSMIVFYEAAKSLASYLDRSGYHGALKLYADLVILFAFISFVYVAAVFIVKWRKKGG